ncbi:CheR family methyltransferase [Magnetococcales bacterium HHB-1]
MVDNTPVWESGLSEKDFQRLSRFIYENLGIMMPSSKKTMLSARLQKRLRILKMDSFAEYVDWVLDPKRAGEELVNFIDIVTTNKTDFFREADHFSYLSETAIPELIKTTGAGVKRRFLIWSAACSSGEEPYTMAIVLKEYEAKHGRFDSQILATDLSTRVLQKGKLGVYAQDKVAVVPMEYKKKYMLRSKDRSKGLVRMSKTLRQMIRFQRLNFMDNDYGLREKMDIIFCRNAIIYFDRPTTEAIINKFCRYLQPGGYLFIGHSETLNDLNTPLVQVAPTIYRFQ